jgi:hypothetical protein
VGLILAFTKQLVSKLLVIFKDLLNLPIVHQTGDTVALSVQTPKHLKEIGLLDSNLQEDKETAINFLFAMALEKVAFFPFAHVVDRWRWGVFEGTIPPSEYNSHWWKLRQEYQGICSPIPRSEKDFDPGAKYHIAANVEFIR